MTFVEWLMTKLRAFVPRRAKPQPAILPPPLPPAVARPAPLPPPELHEPVPAPLHRTSPGPSANRAERRRLERLRRRHDKFVTPKGPKPAKIEREAVEPKPKPDPVPPPEVPEVPEVPEGPREASGNFYMADKHHEDREGKNVLYVETEIHGIFSFRDTILQQLELYFVYLERMRRRDSDAYALYRQVGAIVVPYLANNAHYRNLPERDEKPLGPQKPLTAWFKQTRPGFGCFVYGVDPETEKFEAKPAPQKDGEKTTWWVPKFMYFTKYTKPPPTFERMSGGDIYSMTIWWDQPFNPKFARRHKNGVPQQFGIFVSADGSKVTALRVIETKYLKVHSRKGHEFFRVPQRLWHIPNTYQEWARDHKVDVQRFLTDIFIDATFRLELAQGSMIRVAASKKDMTAVFGVEVDRMPYFFQDRDIHLNEDGHRKRIFHMVRPHQRANGTTVGFHFRGERNFTWAGYDVAITVPGRDHYMLDEFNVGAHDEYWDNKGIRMKEFGAMLSKDIKTGRGGMR